MSQSTNIEFAKSIIDGYALSEQSIIDQANEELGAIDHRIVYRLNSILNENPNYILINYIPVLCDNCQSYKYVTFEFVESDTGHFFTLSIMGKCECTLENFYKKAELPEVVKGNNLREVDDR